VNADKFYDQEYWAGGRRAMPEWSPAFFERVFRPVVQAPSVLDFGCGLGYNYQRLLAARVPRYVGADASAMAVEDARRKGLEVVRVDPETGSVPLPTASFDSAVAIEVFEHLFDPLAAARELHRMLKPHGTLVATVPNFGYHPWRLLAFLRAQVPLEPPAENRWKGSHIRFFSKLTFTRMLRAAGFTDIKISSFDLASVWDIFLAMGHIAILSECARLYLPGVLHLRFLQDLYPNIFAKCLRAVARKPEPKAAI
jgi:SAM-dependent methyltransferase